MTNCSKLVYSPEKRQVAESICSAAPHVSSVEVPSFADMMSRETSAYPLSSTFEEVKDKVAFIAHSSGTTGTLVAATFSSSRTLTDLFFRISEANSAYIRIFWCFGLWRPRPHPARPNGWGPGQANPG